MTISAYFHNDMMEAELMSCEDGFEFRVRCLECDESEYFELTGDEVDELITYLASVRRGQQVSFVFPPERKPTWRALRGGDYGGEV